MKRIVSNWALFLGLLFVYKCLLDFVFLPVYYTVFSYMTGAHYQFNSVKYVLGILMFTIVLFSIIKFFAVRDIYTVIMTILSCLCIIPMLSVYSFVDFVTVDEIIYPTIFWIIMIVMFSKLRMREELQTRFLRIPSIKQASTGLLLLCSSVAIICWAWAGFPILLSLSDSISQRLALRESNMPTLLSYALTILGGVVFPYLFARFLNERRRIYAFIAFVIGFSLYSINGMKTWLFLYAFALLLYFLCDLLKDDYLHICYMIIIGLCVLLVLCAVTYLYFEKVDFLSQFGRIFCIPNGIGFKSITFFKTNQRLYLRESILRSIFPSPYAGGSDFYIDYGANRTLTSARSNNGLWGDAYRNFGLIGIFIYPILTAKVINYLNYTLRGLNLKFSIFVLFLAIWNAVNISFFTWLLSGGAIILIVFNYFFWGEDKKYRIIKNET